MSVKLTYNTKLLFNKPEDKQNLLDMLSAHKAAFNACSKIKFNQKTNHNSIVLLHADFYKKFREENPETPSQVVIRAEHECLSAYCSIKSNKHKISKPVERKKLSMRLDKNSCSRKAGTNTLSIISLGKRIKCQPSFYPKLEEYWKKYKFSDPLVFERDNEVFISFTFDIPTELPQEPMKALGVDLGIRCYAATSEGNLYQDKKFNKEKRQLRFLKDSLKSKGTKSAKRHLKKLKHKEKNKNKNFCFHLANKILKDTKANVLALENLKSLKVKKHKYQNKNRISQVPFYQLLTILTYKADLLSKQVITVCPSYTSQIDHRTGLKDGIRQGCRYIGKDGFVQHADINAAINIANRSKHPISCRLLPATYGQANVNSPIVGDSFPTSQPL